VTSHLTRVKSQLTLQSRRKVLSQLEGEFASLHTGAGTDFHDLREYVRGDEVKDLDWKASARTGELLVKRFTAVRKHTVLLAVSTGRSMAAQHTLEQTKSDVAAEVAGLIGWLALRQTDLIGLVHGNAAHQQLRPPRGSEVSLDRGLEEASAAARPDGPPSDTAALLGHLVRHHRGRTILALVCEDEELSPELAAALRRAAVQHDVLVVTVGDLDPATVPAGAGGPVDVDSGWLLPAWARDDLVSLELAAERAKRRARWHREVTALGAVHEHLDPGDPVLSVVRRLLLRHRHARRR
jgi:uncharacterized protein (DUF58 family)